VTDTGEPLYENVRTRTGESWVGDEEKTGVFFSLDDRKVKMVEKQNHI